MISLCILLIINNFVHMETPVFILSSSILSFILFVSMPCSIRADEAMIVRVNSIGYRTDAVKIASVPSKDAREFSVVNSDGQTVCSGLTSEPVYGEDVKQDICHADFSRVKTPGEYYVEIPGLGRSASFRIADNVYADAFRVAFRGFYLWRCGMAVECQYRGDTFRTEACHLEDGRTDYIGEAGGHRDGTGGWHDAGDFGKYTVNAGVTLGVLFQAWQHFGPRIEAVYPGFLDELRWEMDFILKMQYPDGSGRVSHKLTRKNFSTFIMPQYDKEDRYFTEWSTAATADFTAMCAFASRIFRKVDPAYSKKCLKAAELSWKCLAATPEKLFVQGDFSTGGYMTRDPDDRLWAAAEMWETTGRADCLAETERRIEAKRSLVDSEWDWGEVSNLGVYTYIQSSRRGRSTQLVARIREAIVNDGTALADASFRNVYGRPLGSYFWGCNGTLGRQALNLHMADMISPDPKYSRAIENIISHIFGCNYYNRSYVTGLGINPPMFPHDRRSASDGIINPWPGYIVGGGHTATDWVDEQEDYSRNEIAINWQAALVYALAAVL